MSDFKHEDQGLSELKNIVWDKIKMTITLCGSVMCQYKLPTLLEIWPDGWEDNSENQS